MSYALSQVESDRTNKPSKHHKQAAHHHPSTNPFLILDRPNNVQPKRTHAHTHRHTPKTIRRIAATSCLYSQQKNNRSLYRHYVIQQTQPPNTEPKIQNDIPIHSFGSGRFWWLLWYYDSKCQSYKGHKVDASIECDIGPTFPPKWNESSEQRWHGRLHGYTVSREELWAFARETVHRW